MPPGSLETRDGSPESLREAIKLHELHWLDMSDASEKANHLGSGIEWDDQGGISPSEGYVWLDCRPDVPESELSYKVIPDFLSLEDAKLIAQSPGNGLKIDANGQLTYEAGWVWLEPQEPTNCQVIFVGGLQPVPVHRKDLVETPEPTTMEPTTEEPVPSTTPAPRPEPVPEPSPSPEPDEADEREPFTPSERLQVMSDSLRSQVGRDFNLYGGDTLEFSYVPEGASEPIPCNITENRLTMGDRTFALTGDASSLRIDLENPYGAVGDLLASGLGRKLEDIFKAQDVKLTDIAVRIGENGNPELIPIGFEVQGNFETDPETRSTVITEMKKQRGINVQSSGSRATISLIRDPQKIPTQAHLQLDQFIQILDNNDDSGSGAFTQRIDEEIQDDTGTKKAEIRGEFRLRYREA